jgi:hypothetical protein
MGKIHVYSLYEVYETLVQSFCQECLKERVSLGDVSIYRRIILKWIWKKGGHWVCGFRSAVTEWELRFVKSRGITFPRQSAHGYQWDC